MFLLHKSQDGQYVLVGSLYGELCSRVFFSLLRLLCLGGLRLGMVIHFSWACALLGFLQVLLVLSRRFWDALSLTLCVCIWASLHILWCDYNLGFFVWFLRYWKLKCDYNLLSSFASSEAQRIIMTLQINKTASIERKKGLTFFFPLGVKTVSLECSQNATHHVAVDWVMCPFLQESAVAWLARRVV